MADDQQIEDKAKELYYQEHTQIMFKGTWDNRESFEQRMYRDKALEILTRPEV